MSENLGTTGSIHRRRRRTVAECVEAPEHAGSVDGAERIGEAADDERVVRIGVFADGRARFRASTCASLIAYAEVACAALESGAAPTSLDARALRARVAGVHPQHHGRADLVAGALRAVFPVPFSEVRP
jgi:hypothetical protein